MDIFPQHSEWWLDTKLNTNRNMLVMQAKFGPRDGDDR
jgi:hypothetical protein